MTGSLRSTARNPVAIALMGLLVLVFLILGVGGGGRFPDAFRASHADAVVSAGGHTTITRDFKRIFDNQKQQFEQQSGQPVPVELLVRDGFDQQLLNQLALDEAEVEMVARAGVVPAPALVDGEIRKLPFAFDRVTGKFSESQFTQFLANQGLTPRQAQSELGDELALRHFTAAVEAGFRAPRLYAALNAIAGLENRDVTYFALDPKTVPQPPAPTDAELMAFMKEHAAQLTLPEMRVITVARFSAKALEPGVTIDPAAVEKEFSFQKDTLSLPEKRTLVQVPVKTAAQAALARAGLARGEDPAAVARGLGVEPIRYADQPQSAVADRKLASAAFALPEGQVSGLIQGDLGMAVVKVVKVTPGRAATLVEARPKIEAGLRAKSAQNQAYELSQKFDDARQAGAGVVDAARKAGVTPITVGPVTAEGLDGEGKPAPVLTDKILKAAFAAAAGEEADLTDAGPGEYFALRVDRVIPPALPPLAEKRAELAKAYIAQKYLVALKARAEDLMGQIRKGANIDQVAAQAHGKVVRQTGMQRIQAQQYKALGRDFLQGVFSGKPGDVFAAAAPSGVFIAKLEAVRPGDVTTMARIAETIRGRLSEDYLRDLVGSVKTAARQSVKVDVNLALARQALGVDPAALAKPGAKGAGKAK